MEKNSMKLKRMLSFVVIFLLLATMVACGGTGDGAGNGDGDVTPPVDYDRYVYGGDIVPTIVYPMGMSAADTTAVYNGVKDAIGTYPEYGTDADIEEARHEIVIGNTNRKISRLALRKLKLVDKNTEHDYRYLVYASAGSVAIVYDECEDDLTLTKAITALVADYIAGNSELRLTSGVLFSGNVNIVDYLRQNDNAYISAKWAALEEKVGKDLTDAIKNFYTLYDPDVIYWIANLYDAEAGAFYYSNSGRNTAGYGPDAESTYQILGLLVNMGLGYDVGDKYANIITEEMKTDIINYIKSLQDPESGFFYHPQWGKAFTDTLTLRRARDLSWCTSILSALGSAPTYNAPDGTKGDGIPAAGTELTGSLTEDRAVLVSHAVLAASYAAHLENEDTFRTYLNNLAVKNASSYYALGSTLTSEMPQIIERDKQLKAAGATYSLVGMVIDFLNKSQNPETGCWVATSDYNAIDGLLKISGIYSKAGVEIPNAERAADSALKAIISETPIGSAVQSYNPWNSYSNVISILNKYGSTQIIDGVEMTGPERAQRLRDIFYENAPLALQRTREKIQPHQRDDGSFSYNATKSTPNSCGAPVALAGILEGDVNATHLFTSGLIGALYSSLGLSSYKVPLFGTAERYLLLYTIENLQPIIKDGTDEDEVVPNDPLNFSGDKVGEAPADISKSLASDGASVTVVSDPTNKGHGNVVRFVSNSGKGDTAYIPMVGNPAGATMFGFKGDFYVESSGTSNGYAIQMILGDACMAYLEVKSNGTVDIVESSSRENNVAVRRLIGTVNVNEWFNLEAKFFTGDESTVRIKWYLNGELIMVTDNYFDKAGIKLGDNPGKLTNPTPSTKTMLYTYSSAKLSILMDNVCTYGEKTTYTKESAALKYNVDETGEKTVHSFDDNTLPTVITAPGATVASKQMSLTGTLKMKAVNTQPGGNTYTLTMRVGASVNEGDIANIRMLDSFVGTGAVDITVKCVTESGTKRLVLYDNVDKKTVAGVSLAADGTLTELTVQFTIDGNVVIKVGGSKVAEYKNTSSSALLVRPENLEITVLGTSTLVIDDLSYTISETVLEKKS